jgi:endonuclease III-like uncharacterized protein
MLYNEFHALTVAVGKAHCGRTARCEGCPLAEDLQDRELGGVGDSLIASKLGPTN